MTFEVKYRNKTGSVEYMRLDAENRSAVFASLRELGISAIQVSEAKGKAKPRKAATGGAPLSGRIKGLMALVAVCVIGAVVWLCVSKDEPKPTVEEKKPAKEKRIEVVKPEVSDMKGDSPTNAETATVRTLTVKEQWLGVDVDHKVARTNGTMVIETIYTADGKSHKYYHDTTPPIFEHASDQILALATADNGNGDAPPLPGISNFENDFGEAIKKQIVINDDDSPEVKEVKERVILARKNLLDLMAEGMSADEVLRENQRMQEDNAYIRNQVVLELRNFVDSGDFEGARLFCEKVNPTLQEAGIMEVEVPRTREEIRAERLERRAVKRMQEGK